MDHHDWLRIGAMFTDILVIACFVNDWLDKQRAARSGGADG
jgi:hypothetical protein